MKLRERIAYYIFIRHVEDFYFKPYNDGTDLGTAGFKIEPKWLNISERIAGCSYKELVQKAAKEFIVL